MNFAYPGFLWGLLAISIPIIIHFLELRRFRKQLFPDNFFLQELLRKKRQQQKIKQWIVLLLRVLFITFLTLAFAQPIKLNQQQAFQHASKAIIFVDNSMSMQTYLQRFSLLEEAKNKSQQLVQQFPPQTLWKIITLDDDYSSWLMTDEALEKIKQIQYSPFSTRTDQLLQRIADELYRENDDHLVLFILSDFQRSQGRWDGLGRMNRQAYLVPLGVHDRSNVTVDSVWLLTPISFGSTQATIIARVQNYGKNSMEKFPVSLVLFNNLVSTEMVNLPAESKVDVSFFVSLPSDKPYIHGYVEIEDQQMPFDNQYYFAFMRSASFPVVHIAGKYSSNVISTIFSNDTLFDYHAFSPAQINYDLLSKASLIILEELDYLPSGLDRQLKTYVEQGGNLVIIPPTSRNLLATTYEPILKAFQLPSFSMLDTSSTRVVDIQVNHFLYKGVFATLPERQSSIQVYKHYAFAEGDGQTVLTMANNRPFMADFVRGKGHVFLLAVPLRADFSNFSTQALVVPTFMQMAFRTEAIPSLGYSLDFMGGIPIRATFAKEEKPPYINIRNQVIYPGFTYGNPLNIFLQRAIRDPGIAEVWYGGKLVHAFGLNISRNESNPQCLTEQELDSLSKSYPQLKVIHRTEQVKPAWVKKYMQAGVPLWKWMLLVALLSLVLELLILRFWK